jgi:hypothetical protein
MSSRPLGQRGERRRWRQHNEGESEAARSRIMRKKKKGEVVRYPSHDNST